MSLPYMPLYIDDYEADTAHLTIAEDGAYNRLLRLLWRTPGCSIPDDDEWVFRRMRAASDEDRAIVLSVLDEFFERKNGRIFSPRLAREHKKVDETSRRRSKAGKMGGRPRAIENKGKTQKPGKSREKAGPKHPEPEPDSNPLTPFEILSDVLKPAVAEDFIAHRREIKKPLTERAAKAMVGRLRDHPNPNAVVNESIANGWQGVFPDKVKSPKRREVENAWL